jgi:hypothetical protein
MKDLVVCAACKRHVKPSEVACPFCGSGLSVAPAVAAPARSGAAGGRAALFLASSALASGVGACGVPAYGVGIDDVPFDGRNLTDAGRRRDAGARDGGINVVPVYGTAVDAGVFPIPPYGVAIPDAGSDAGCPRVDRLPVPVYGVPIDAGAPDPCSDAGPPPDAATDVDSGLIGVPVYGVALDR